MGQTPEDSLTLVLGFQLSTFRLLVASVHCTSLHIASASLNACNLSSFVYSISIALAPFTDWQWTSGDSDIHQ